MSRVESFGDALRDLHLRLQRVEAHLGLAASREAEPAPEVRPATADHARVTPPPLPVIEVPAPNEVQDDPPRPAAVTVYPEYQAPQPAPVEQTEFEQTIGLKWAGWIGAVVVVIGAGLGIKYAYDQRWFEILPPAGRLALMSMGGIALIFAGEIVFRRIHRVAAACLFGAGVSTLFLVSYAGHGYYRLYEPETAYLLMALTTAVGAAVSFRGNLLSIAVLAQIGGNLAPMLLESDRPMLGAFLTYLLALQAVALILTCWSGDGRWRALRVMSLTTTFLWMLAIHRDTGGSAAGLKITFTLLYAALYHLELISSRGARYARPARQGDVVFATVVTVFLTAALLSILRHAPDITRGGWVLCLAGAFTALGYGLQRHPLALVYRVHAAALVVVAVPVALSGVWVVLGWAILALTFATLGKLLDLPVSRHFAFAVWLLAFAHLGGWTLAPVIRTLSGPLDPSGPHAVWLQLLGVDLRAYLILAWLLAAAGHVIACLIHDAASRLARLTQVLAGVAIFTASVAGLPPAGATFAIVAYAWLLLGVDLLHPRLGLAVQSAAVVILVTLKWVAIDTLAERLAPGWSPAARRPLFNAVMCVGVLISATMGALYWLRRDALTSYFTRRGGAPQTGARFSPAGPALALAAILMALFAIGLTFEIDRIVEAARPDLLWPVWQLKHLAWTILWTLCLSAYLLLARALEPDAALRPGTVTAAVALVVLVAMKFLVVDTLGFRVLTGVAPSLPVLNIQTLAAAVVVGGMGVVAFLTGDSSGRSPGGVRGLAGFLAVLVVLWGGTLEIDRAFESLRVTGTGVFANPALARQVAISIFWSVFAVAAIIAGFAFRTKGLRYFGLALFAVTLLKVVLFDLSDVQTGYRVLSFLGLGLLLMGTSVLYGKLSPVLLRAKDDNAGTIAAGGAQPTV